MEREQAQHPVRRLCRVLGVSPSGYGAWRRRKPAARARANAQLTSHILPMHQASRGTSGALRGQAERRARGLPCGQNRVARLLRQAGVVGGPRRRPVRVQPTRRDPAATPAPDLVQRACRAAAPDRRWGADRTALPTEHDGVLFLAVMLDAWRRRVVGWSLREQLRTAWVLAARERAVGKRRPEAGVMHHADHGGPYTSVLFGERCAAAGIRSSRGAGGECLDNALVESLFAPRACALLAHHRLQTHEEARTAVFDGIASLYHRQRRHAALG